MPKKNSKNEINKNLNNVDESILNSSASLRFNRPTLDSVRSSKIDDLDIKKYDNKGYNLYSEEINFLESLSQKTYSFIFSYNIRDLILVYASIAILVSLLADFFPFPKSYFSDKKNIFNVYFVKLGWGWTLFLVGPFILMTGLCQRKELKNCLIDLTRLFYATLWWFVSTELFLIIDKGSNYKSYLQFLSPYLHTKGFDISGHTFLLFFSLLVIYEESRAFKSWNDFHKGRHYLDDKSLKQKVLNFLVRITLLLLSCLVILWNIMLLSTLIYFHNIMQKIYGLLFAIGGWILTYKILYNSNCSLLPGQPS